MRLLLDTHIVVWVADDSKLLTARERAWIEADEAELAVSVVSLWELRLKWHSLSRSGDRKGPLPPERMLRFVKSVGWSLLQLSADDPIATLDVALAHKDPFDEMLLIQAQRHGMRLLTRDARLAAHPLAVIG